MTYDSFAYQCDENGFVRLSNDSYSYDEKEEKYHFQLNLGVFEQCSLFLINRGSNNEL